MHIDLQVPNNHLLKKHAGTSRITGELLMAGSRYQNVITTDLVDDPILTDNNIRYFKKISKEMYNFTLVSRDYSAASVRCRVACPNLPPYAGCDQALAEEDRKAKSSREWPLGARCQGKTHIRRAGEEHLSSERT
jgi:hypothetical protein